MRVPSGPPTRPSGTSNSGRRASRHSQPSSKRSPGLHRSRGGRRCFKALASGPPSWTICAGATRTGRCCARSGTRRPRVRMSKPCCRGSSRPVLSIALGTRRPLSVRASNTALPSVATSTSAATAGSLASSRAPVESLIRTWRERWTSASERWPAEPGSWRSGHCRQETRGRGSSDDRRQIAWRGIAGSMRSRPSPRIARLTGSVATARSFLREAPAIFRRVPTTPGRSSPPAGRSASPTRRTNAGRRGWPCLTTTATRDLSARSRVNPAGGRPIWRSADGAPRSALPSRVGVVGGAISRSAGRTPWSPIGNARWTRRGSASGTSSPPRPW
jgi:hypothetical protein